MKKCKACQKEIDSKASKCPHCQSDQRNWFMKHKITAVVLVLIVIGIASSGGKSTSTISTSSTSGEVKKEVQQPMKITARELADDFDSNQVAAESKWKDKLVEFNAVVTNITDSGLSFSNVASKQFSMAQIACRVVDKQQLLSLKNGENVTVKGTVGNQSLGVIEVSDCSVVK